MALSRRVGVRSDVGSTRSKVVEYFLGGGERFPSRYRAVEVLGVVAYVWMGWLIAVEVHAGIEASPSAAWLAIPAAAAGVVWSDFMSGFVHWLADTYASATTPFWGPKFVKPFREHHVDPLGITRHDFVEANGDNCIFAQIAFVPTYLLCPIRHAAWATAFGIFTLVFSAGVLLTSIAHGWAHMAEPPRLVKRLQRAGLLLSPEHHAVHHAKPHHKHYCITTGWLNPLLDRTRFFRHLERSFELVGIRRGNDAERAGHALD
jgi:ubiquitin-conjugating enzyme E2 variant